MTRTPSTIQFLYLVASGHGDGVYKIGISDDPQRRLEQIKVQYDVPNAYILETMDVSTRQDVLALEGALHRKYKKKQAKHYQGREWFKLTQRDIADLEALYQEQSDSFAQALAYFGMVERQAEIKQKAEKQEIERAKKINYNRSYGKRYDTKPKGILKEYNDLSKTITDGHLGQRFKVEILSHPAQQMLDDAHALFRKNIQTALPIIGIAGCIAGTSGAAMGAVLGKEPDTSVAFGIMGGISGLVVGRGKRERMAVSRQKQLDDLSKAIANEQFDEATLSSELVGMKDCKANRYFVIKEYSEERWKLRNAIPHIPNVQLPKLREVKTESKRPIPLPIGTLTKIVLVTFTPIYALCAWSSAMKEKQEQRYRSQIIESPPIVRVIS